MTTKESAPVAVTAGDSLATAKARLSIAAVKARNSGQDRIGVDPNDIAVLLAAHSDLDRAAFASPGDGVAVLVARLRALLAAATPGDLSTAERHLPSETVECPFCQEGEVYAADYCNFDGKALGVQFYGIGKEFGAHERLWTETIAALPTLLDEIQRLSAALALQSAPAAKVEGEA